MPFTNGRMFELILTRKAGGWETSIDGTRRPEFDFEQRTKAQVQGIQAAGFAEGTRVFFKQSKGARRTVRKDAP